MIKTREEIALLSPEARLEYNKQLNKLRVQKYRDANRNTEKYKQMHKEETYKYRKQHPDIIKNLNQKHSKTHRDKIKRIQEDTKKISATILQNALRNKLAKKRILDLKQQNANMVISNINKKRKEKDVNELVQKFNAIVLSNDIMNEIFPSVINAIPEKKKRGRPRKQI